MLQLENLSKSFFRGQVDEIEAIKDVCLTVNSGDFVTIVGSNGAGKSTLLNLIAGVFPPDEGRILLDGEDITSLPENQRAKFIGRVYQDPKMGTASRMSIEENIAMALKRGQARRLGRAVTNQRREMFRTYLAHLDMGLEGRLHSLVNTLSGGQQQALAVVMATISQPSLLLLDEHVASLDPKAGRKILELTDRVVREGRLTTLMVTHNMEHALQYGNRLVMMHEGRIVLDIEAEEKATLTVADLVERFEAQSGSRFVEDRMLLAGRTTTN